MANKGTTTRKPQADNLLDRFSKLSAEEQARVRAVIGGGAQPQAGAVALIAPKEAPAIKPVNVGAAPVYQVPAGYVLVPAGQRRGAREAKPANGVQIVPETTRTGEVVVNEGEVFNSINFITVDENNQPSKSHPDLYAIIQDEVRNAQVQYNYFIKRNGWSPSKDFQGNAMLPGVRNKGRFYLPDDAFLNVVRRWAAVMPQKFVAIG